MIWPRTIKLNREDGPEELIILKSKVNVTVTLSTKKAYNSAMLMVRTLKLSRDVGPQQDL